MQYWIPVQRRSRMRAADPHEAACLLARFCAGLTCSDLKGVMMRLKALLIRLSLLLTCVGYAAFAIDGPSAGQAVTSAGVKAFVGARLIDGSGLPAIENAALIVRDGRVEAVGLASEIKPPAGAQTINLA